MRVRFLFTETMVKSQNIVLIIVVLGTLMGALDSTIVLLAFPTITLRLNSNPQSQTTDMLPLFFLSPTRSSVRSSLIHSFVCLSLCAKRKKEKDEERQKEKETNKEGSVNSIFFPHQALPVLSRYLSRAFLLVCLYLVCDKLLEEFLLCRRGLNSAK